MRFRLVLDLANRSGNELSGLETDRYHFLETDIDILNFSHRYFIDHRYRYSKICLPIYFPIFQQSIL